MTMVTDKAITRAGFIWTVMASAEQIPKTCTVIGFSWSRGLVRSFMFLDENRWLIGSLFCFLNKWKIVGQAFMDGLLQTL